MGYCIVPSLDSKSIHPSMALENSLCWKPQILSILDLEKPPCGSSYQGSTSVHIYKGKIVTMNLKTVRKIFLPISPNDMVFLD
jgi:hypothetical protein